MNIKANVFLAAMLFCLSLGVASIKAADLSEDQLIAVDKGSLPVFCQVSDGNIAVCPGVLNTDLNYLRNYLKNNRIQHINALIGTGASMGQFPDGSFDPFLVTFFGRTTVSRPVPNLRNQSGNGLDLRVGEQNTVLLTGNATLNDAVTGAQLASAPSYTDQDDWALSRGQFRRSTASGQLSQLYVVKYTSTLQLPGGWAWMYVPASCSYAYTTGVAVTCNEQSAPFYIGPNPGEPMP